MMYVVAEAGCLRLSFTKSCLAVTASMTTADRFAAPAQVSEDGGYKVRDEPHIFIANVLVDINKDQDPRDEKAHQYIGPLRDIVRRVVLLKEKNRKRDAGKEERE